MELRLEREPSIDQTTIGKLYVNSVFECFTLEDQIRVEKIDGQTAISAGKYRVTITLSVRFRRMLPLLLNVPGFTGIRIHPGNTDADTEGCILVGRERQISSVTHSLVALEALQPKIALALARSENVTLTIVNPVNDPGQVNA